MVSDTIVTSGTIPFGLGAIAAFLIAVAGCAQGPAVERDVAATSTVRVRAQGCGPRVELGTGTAIDGGLVVTAAHVVAGSDSFSVVDSEGADVSATVVLFDPDLDLAVMRPSAAIAEAAPIRAEKAEAGEPGVVGVVVSDGSIGVIDVDVVRSVTIKTTDIYREDAVERPGFEIAAKVDHGDSGTMVHLASGGVGIVWARSDVDDNRAWAIDLPASLRDSSFRETLTSPVGTGACM